MVSFDYIQPSMSTTKIFFYSNYHTAGVGGFPQMWGVKKSENFTAEVFCHLKKIRTTALDIQADIMENEDSSAEIIMGFFVIQAVFIIIILYIYIY